MGKTETLDITKLSDDDKKALMQQLSNEAKAKKQQQKDDRKAYKQLTNEFVEDNIDALIHHNDITGIIIENLFKAYKPIQSLKSEIYGHEHQDSHKSTLPDGSASIQIGYNVNIKFDGTEASGVQKIKEFIKSLSDNDTSTNVLKLAKAVNTFLKPHTKTGMLNPSKIIELSKLRDDFNDERFNDGLDIIFEAQIKEQKSMFVSGWKFIEDDLGKPKKLTFRFSV